MGGFFQEEQRAAANEISNMIEAWAAQTFDAGRAHAVTNYVRALARHAIHPDKPARRLCQTRAEADALKEAAQDIMEIVESIAQKARRAKEGGARD